MILDLKPEQQLILEPATQSGVSQERVLDQDFATIQATIEQCDCGIAIRDAFSAQIAHGFAQAERGELIDEEDAIQMLLQRHEKRQFGWNTRDSWKKS